MSTKKNPRVTAKAITLVTNINNFVAKNKANFKAGNVMSEKDFLALVASIPGFDAPAYNSKFTTAADVTKYNLTKVAAYTKLNKVLMHRGLIIKARDYYSSFEVVDKSRVSHEVERIAARAVYASTASNILRVGQSSFNSKFTKLKSAEILRVSAHINRGFSA